MLFTQNLICLIEKLVIGRVRCEKTSTHRTWLAKMKLKIKQEKNKIRGT